MYEHDRATNRNVRLLLQQIHINSCYAIDLMLTKRDEVTKESERKYKNETE